MAAGAHGPATLTASAARIRDSDRPQAGSLATSSLAGDPSFQNDPEVTAGADPATASATAIGHGHGDRQCATLLGVNGLDYTAACGGCGRELEPGASLCPECGWDATTALPVGDRAPLGRRLAAAAARLLVYGVVVAVLIGGFLRLRRVGPGPDLPTTLRWVLLGDEGRAAELETLHRAHEIGAAAARYSVREMEPFAFDGDWATELAPYATMRIRGWIPMLFVAADTGMAPASVRELYEIRAHDGWGRPYRVDTRVFGRDDDPMADPEVVVDLADGLQRSFFHRADPVFGRQTSWMRLELVSAGGDGRFETGDDVEFVTYVPVDFTFRVRGSDAELRDDLSAAYTRGTQYFRFTSHRGDLIDARLLAEWRLETVY